MKKIFGVLVALALTFAFCGSALAADKMLPKFSLQTIDGKTITTESFKEKKGIFVFSQMACRQCRMEMDELNGMVDDFKGQLYIVLVDMNSEAAIPAYQSKYKIPVILDPDFSIPAALDLQTTPSTIVFDAKGKVVYEKTGFTRGDSAEMKKFL
jgi:peroxiredoxin